MTSALTTPASTNSASTTPALTTALSSKRTPICDDGIIFDDVSTSDGDSSFDNNTSSDKNSSSDGDSGFDSYCPSYDDFRTENNPRLDNGVHSSKASRFDPCSDEHPAIYSATSHS